MSVGTSTHIIRCTEFEKMLGMEAIYFSYHASHFLIISNMCIVRSHLSFLQSGCFPENTTIRFESAWFICRWFGSSQRFDGAFVVDTHEQQYLPRPNPKLMQFDCGNIDCPSDLSIPISTILERWIVTFQFWCQECLNNNRKGTYISIHIFCECVCLCIWV